MLLCIKKLRHIQLVPYFPKDVTITANEFDVSLAAQIFNPCLMCTQDLSSVVIFIDIHMER